MSVLMRLNKLKVFSTFHFLMHLWGFASAIKINESNDIWIYFIRLVYEREIIILIEIKQD